MPLENKLNDFESAIVVALGSNLSGEYASPQILLEAALRVFPAAGLMVEAQSQWWRSVAWPDPADPHFVNGVVIVQADLPATDVLHALHQVEESFGRRRHERNAPRTLDLDLIAHGRMQSDRPMLPHPRAHERAFVMRPLAQIAPAWRHPTLGLTAQALALTASVGADACILEPPA